MRADRLISILMLLQSRGRMTARELAGELEVSERTIYRDVVALSAAGLPVYTADGPGGGISLIEEYQTGFTGLLPAELQALAVLEVPEPLIRLGLGGQLKTALLKLTTAAPEFARDRQSAAARRIHLDASAWRSAQEPALHLPALRDAVLQDHRARIVFHGEYHGDIAQVIEPLGLVAKAGAWHLVYQVGEGIRVRNAATITAVEVLQQTFSRPLEFALVPFWQQHCAEVERQQQLFEVRALVLPSLAARLPSLLQQGRGILLNTPQKHDGEEWTPMLLTFESFEDARTRLLGFGDALKVLEPQALRCSIFDFACQVCEVYR
jgi:predicted DNA-binding transcriptional regulator YafY